MTQYSKSTFGYTIVAYEPPEEQTKIRIFFIIATIIIGTTTLIKALSYYFELKQRQKSNSPRNSLPYLTNLVFFLFIFDIIVHNAHFADNIYRPAYYHEPKFIYEKFVIGKMDFTFFGNFLVTYFGLSGMRKLFDFDKSGLVIDRISCYKMFGFVLSSFGTTMHYMVDPPTEFKWDANLTIAGETFVTTVLAVTVYYCLRQTAPKNYHPLNSMDELLVNEQLTTNPTTRHRSPHRTK